jgi:hypothetical protein
MNIDFNLFKRKVRNLNGLDLLKSIKELMLEQIDLTYEYNHSYVEVNSFTQNNIQLSESHVGKYIRLEDTTGVTVTITQNNNIKVGSVVTIEQKGAGQVEVVAGSGVIINAAAGTKTSSQYAGIQIVKVAENVYTVIGGVA